MSKRVTINTLMEMKKSGEKITMLTAYDYPTARILDDMGIDSILVGDSAANVIMGYPDTRPVSMDEMIHHTRIVSRAVVNTFLIGDMPFMSYQASIEDAIRNAGRFVKEANVDAVKLEGRYFDTIRRITEAGIPVVGHLGLTPQSASLLGGYVVQGKTFDKAKRLIHDAEEIEKAGAIMLVLEMVPEEVASIISHRLKIPVIGIGAGVGCDGQVLVLHDMLGLGGSFKFLKKYANLKDVISKAVKDYIDDVKGGRFPARDNSFQMPSSEFKRLKRYLK